MAATVASKLTDGFGKAIAPTPALDPPVAIAAAALDCCTTGG